MPSERIIALRSYHYHSSRVYSVIYIVFENHKCQKGNAVELFDKHIELIIIYLLNNLTLFLFLNKVIH